MKDSLAQVLLGKVMDWDEFDLVAGEYLEPLQTLARYKFDHYQQFRPGRKFFESLADWLQQFEAGDEREVALNFIKNRLIFISNDEMEQLVRILYPEVIRPIIREYVGTKLNIPPYLVTRIEANSEFARVRRRSLFLGLSDSARIDEFRRSNRELSHEQVYGTYEVDESRLVEMRQKLLEDIGQGLSGAMKFELVFLIDDFAGSGRSIIREKEGQFDGRLKRFSDVLQMDYESKTPVLSGPDTKIYICLYMATQQALEHIRQQLNNYSSAIWNSPPQVCTVQALNGQHRVTDSTDPEFCALLDKYYNSDIEDIAKQVGGTSSKYGFAHCALPLVLAHNTPNNSVSLLWAPPPMKALFPRFERHIESKG